MASDDVLEPFYRRALRIDQLRQEIEAVQQRRTTLANSIKDHLDYDLKHERASIAGLKRQQDVLQEAIRVSDSLDGELALSLEAAKRTRVGLWKLRQYFSSEQALIRAQSRRLQKQFSTNQKDLKSKKAELAKKVSAIEDVRSRLEIHLAFDLSGVRSSLAKAEAEERLIESVREPLLVEFARLRSRLEPHLSEYRQFQSSLASAESDIRAAEQYAAELDSASSGAERARIHERCESRLGDGSPKKIIGERSKIKRHYRSSISKLERRISEEIKKFEIRIDHLIVDGNNVCYEREEFIGVRALETLIDKVGGRFKLTIVFDASIRRLLKSKDQNIEVMLGSGCKIYISPTRTSADEYIMKIAGKDTGAYILSNDRFAEYRDYDVVRSERVLRFMIADDRLLINELDIAADILAAP